jgi:hypothetical protein
MSKVAFNTPISGNGMVTFDVPPTNSFNTLTIPDESGNLLTSENPVVSKLNGGPLAGFRNVIINGACDISQRPQLVVSNNVGGYGGPDRYFANNNGAGGSFTQSVSSMTVGGETKRTVRQTVTAVNTSIASGNFWHGIVQTVENTLSYHLAGSPVVLSFWFNTNVPGTYSVAIRVGTAPNQQSYVTTFIAAGNVPTKVVIKTTIPARSIGFDGGIGVVVNVGFLNTGSYATSTLNQWQTGNYVCATGASNWGSVNGAFIELTELQLEPGTEATPFERRPYPTEQAFCYRYYYTATWVGGATGDDDFLTNSFGGAFPVTMRATPTITVSAGGLSSHHSIAPAAQSPNPNSVRFVWSGSGYRNDGAACTVTFAASAELA